MDDKSLPRISSAACLVLCLALLPAVEAFAEKLLQTKFTSIHYAADADLSDFFWRITGQRFDVPEDAAPAKTRVDEIVLKVQSLLGMYPEAFKVDIALQTPQEKSDVALYSHKTRFVTAAPDRVTDGVLAHEIAHAVICAYFKDLPPAQTQEILAQYVDRHLWGEV